MFKDHENESKTFHLFKDTLNLFDKVKMVK